MVAVEAVIFDLDNTILDRNATFGKFTEGLIGAYFGHIADTRSIYDRIIELDQDGYKDKRVLFAELRDELPWLERPPVSELLDCYRSEYVRHAAFMDQAREVIAYAKRKYRIGIITNGGTRIQYGKIDRLGIRDEFEFIIVSEEAGVKKPDPGIFDMALRRLGLPPEACLYIGDHPVNDIEGAARAGMGTIWLQVNQPWREGLSAEPLHTIRRLSDLFELL